MESDFVSRLSAQSTLSDLPAFDVALDERPHRVAHVMGRTAPLCRKPHRRERPLPLRHLTPCPEAPDKRFYQLQMFKDSRFFSDHSGIQQQLVGTTILPVCHTESGDPACSSHLACSRRPAYARPVFASEVHCGQRFSERLLLTGIEALPILLLLLLRECCIVTRIIQPFIVWHVISCWDLRPY